MSTTRQKSSLYTRTGDTGTSSLYTGERRSKDDEVFHALGDIDEVNCAIGVALEYYSSIEVDDECKDDDDEKLTAAQKAVLAVSNGSNLIDVSITSIANGNLRPMLLSIQCILFMMGSNVATPRDNASSSKTLATTFDDNGALVESLERWIDEMHVLLPPLKNFILPSGGLTSSHLHMARAVCRRAERNIATLALSGSCDISVKRYINRLSDFLFIAARFAAAQCGSNETPFKKQSARPLK